MLDMTITFPGGVKVDAQMGNHTIQTDQPKDDGGEDAAPSPYALFMASLGTCAGFYVMQFCKSRDLPTDGIRLVQDTDWNKENKRAEKIRIRIEVPADFPEKYKKALIRSADQCTVKRALFAPPEFEIETVSG